VAGHSQAETDFTASTGQRHDIGFMPAVRFTDRSLEEPALRRLTLLLERLKDDSGGTDPGVDTLLVSLHAIRESAGASSTVENLEASIDRVRTTPAPDLDATSRMLRENVVHEATGLVQRLKRNSGGRASDVAESPSLMEWLALRFLRRSRGLSPGTRSR
jgi:hypothetical protein